MPYPLDFLSIPTESGGDDARHYSADEVVDHNRKRVVRELDTKENIRANQLLIEGRERNAGPEERRPSSSSYSGKAAGLGAGLGTRESLTSRLGKANPRRN
jgi:hypothetical protein